MWRQKVAKYTHCDVLMKTSCSHINNYKTDSKPTKTGKCRNSQLEPLCCCLYAEVSPFFFSLRDGPELYIWNRVHCQSENEERDGRRREGKYNIKGHEQSSKNKNKAFSDGVTGRLCIQLPAQQHAMCYSGWHWIRHVSFSCWRRNNSREE